MNARIFASALAAGVTLTLLVAGCSTTPRAAHETSDSHQTGSSLPQKGQTHGPVNTSMNNVRVLGKKDLDQSGEANLRDALIQQGAIP